MAHNVAVLIGSLRRDSLNRKLATALIGMSPPTLSFTEVGIADLPIYNADLDEGNVPQPWTRFRDAVRACHAVLFLTPEYNRSIPGGLKNAIDVGSRPYGKSVWSGKPGAVISVSPGAIGGFGANQHLRQTFVFLDILPMQQPEAYIGAAGKLFADDGSIAVPQTHEFMEKYLHAFAKWIDRVGAGTTS
ncbi:MAG TPA: NAD(P)H-dependent oxidoreductase [Casimicrobiaceae bacterium]|nr:NAD(P)H-dependent oxidoreductase [Casimicrobiaceae bacterium]